MRGIIVNPGLEVDYGSVNTVAGVDPNLLRMWLLYWDSIAHPVTSAINIGLGNDFEYLVRCGAITEYKHALFGELSEIIVSARNQTFFRLEKDNPGSWAVATGKGSYIGPEIADGRALQVELVGALPIPNEDVPFEDILEFREKRKDEREALMDAINSLYQDILKSPDKALAKLDATKKIARSAKDVLSATQETNWKYRLGNLVADFNLVGSAFAVYSSIRLGDAFPAIVANSLIAGGTLTVREVLGIANPQKNDSPYRYVCSYHREVFHK